MDNEPGFAEVVQFVLTIITLLLMPIAAIGTAVVVIMEKMEL